ncbi:MAG: L-rhamnose isomerase [Clostridiales bacterium]|nr:L-rhamnose isomerase [Clostridiales bacterium]
MSEEYRIAKEKYASIGVDTEVAIKRVSEIPVSIHCWQGDDVRGFESPDGDLTGGIQTTGNFPGRAKNIDQLREDIEMVFSLVPGKKRLNLHAIYLDNGGKKVERNKIEPKHFASWVDWARENKVGLDFNPTCFSSPMMKDGLTLSHPDKAIRDYWIEHCIASRKIAEYFGKELGTPAVTNLWVPDGFKDNPINRYEARQRLISAMDEIYSVKIDKKYNLDSAEGKLFGIGAESCTVGQHEIYLAYALTRGIMVTLDSGHYHPTEVISDKISSVLSFVPEILLHVSRPVRWDSDHVIILDDELKAIGAEIIRNNFENRVHIGLDYFDASINRIAAWTVGARNIKKSLLLAALEPTKKLTKIEREGDFTSRLELTEEYKTYPFGAVWDEFCARNKVPVGEKWIAKVKKYTKDVLSDRD